VLNAVIVFLRRRRKSIVKKFGGDRILFFRRIFGQPNFFRRIFGWTKFFGGGDG